MKRLRKHIDSLERTTLNPKTVESQLKDIQAAIMSGTQKAKRIYRKKM